MLVKFYQSTDQQLEDIGYVKQYEGDKGFIYAKNVGGGYINIAEALKALENEKELTVRFYDASGIEKYPTCVNEKELRLFARKLKEWKGQYESENSK